LKSKDPKKGTITSKNKPKAGPSKKYIKEILTTRTPHTPKTGMRTMPQDRKIGIDY